MPLNFIAWDTKGNSYSNDDFEDSLKIFCQRVHSEKLFDFEFEFSNDCFEPLVNSLEVLFDGFQLPDKLPSSFQTIQTMDN